MTETFTPLTFGTLPLRPASATAAATLNSATPVITAFEPMNGAPSITAASAESHSCKPDISLGRNALGQVTSIRVQCGCGRVTELNCVY